MVKKTLSDAASNIVPWYLALIQRGFSVTQEPSAVTESGMLWVAEDETTQFFAEDLVTLLGLVAMRETRGQNLRASDQDIESFLARFGVP